MISIVAHGILGTSYRRDVVVSDGLTAEDMSVLYDMRRYLSKQYGEGVPATGWVLQPSPSGMWLSRIERSFDINYAPAFIAVSLLIPRSKRLQGMAALDMVSQCMVLNHSTYIKQNVIKFQPDWSFLKPLAEEVDSQLEPIDKPVAAYHEQMWANLAYFPGNMSMMIDEMWSDKFSCIGTIVLGNGILDQSKDIPSIDNIVAPEAPIGTNKSTDTHPYDELPVIEKTGRHIKPGDSNKHNKNKNRWVLVFILIAAIIVTVVEIALNNHQEVSYIETDLVEVDTPTEDDESVVIVGVEEVTEPDKIIIANSDTLFLYLTWENVYNDGELLYEKYNIATDLKKRADDVIELANSSEMDESHYRKSYSVAKRKVGGNMVDTLIHELRRKIEPIPTPAVPKQDEKPVENTAKSEIIDSNVKKREDKENVVVTKKQPESYYKEQYNEWKKLYDKKEYDAAFACLLKSAEGDYFEALSDLVYHYFKGDVYDHDIKLAEKYAKRGADLGYVDCQLWLGQICRETNRKEQALQWFEKSGKNQGWSAYLAGEMYENGEGTQRNRERAVYWYRISAKNYYNVYSKNAQEALDRLGENIYEDGEYMNLVRQEHVWSNMTPKEMYEEGRLWIHNFKPQQYAYLLKSAEQGYPFAQEMLGNILKSNDAVKLGIYDENKSEIWLLKAEVGYVDYVKDLEQKVKNGDSEAMYELAGIYHYGLCGKDENISLAKKYYKMGAESGDDGCQLKLGQILREEGRKKDALRWFIKAGEQGQGWAAYLAGEMYENGEGTKQDIDKAIQWYTASAKTTNAYASHARDALIRLGQPVP